MTFKTIALLGNQNSGKTTLFNALTGATQHVGNFPGVTVEKKQGNLKKHPSIHIVDLPGIYSLTPYSMEEIVSTEFLLKEQPEAIINIIDATNIERNLYLTMQLLELDIPMIIALNMMDEVEHSGNSIDIKVLEEKLGVPIIPISASKKIGLEELIHQIDEISNIGTPILRPDFCFGDIHDAISSIADCIKEEVKQIQYPLRYCITRIIEGDEEIFKEVSLSVEQLYKIEQIIQNMEKCLQTDRVAAIVDMRYLAIETICQQAVCKNNETIEQHRSEKIDRILTHKWLGIPIFLMIMLLIFYLTFYAIGIPLQDIMEIGISYLSTITVHFLETVHVAPWLLSLIEDGILTGVGNVLSFLPIIVLLFFFLSLLEDSGYMARVAFIMDNALRKIGLSGRSFVPMLVGFGCSVPAIMATRTLSSERDRKMTIIIIPFMSCSAKLPIYGMIISAFFSTKAFMVMFLVYCIGIFVAIISALLLKTTIFSGDAVPFVMELPAYRVPTLKNVSLHMWEKAKDFLKKAFTIIFLASIIIWFLQSFNLQLKMVEDSSNSILAIIGSSISWIFKPLGFTDWRLSTSLLTGVLAKESVVSTISVLLNATNASELSIVLQQLLTPTSALAFLTFTVLYMPCIAAFAATKRELQSGTKAITVALYQTGIAYLVAIIVYHLASLF